MPHQRVNIGNIKRATLVFLLIVAIAATAAILSTRPALAEYQLQSGDSARHPDRLLIGLTPDTTLDELNAFIAPYGLVVESYWPDLDLAAVRPAVSSAQLNDALATSATAQAALNATQSFRYVDFDGFVQTAGQPNDPRAPEQWALAAINAQAGRQMAAGDNRLVIAVIDTGFSPQHEDLGLTRLWVNQRERTGVSGVDDDENGYIDDIYGWDWVGDDNDASDEHGHGTHVAGIIAAHTNNGAGIAGVGGNLSIAPLRVLDKYGTGYISDLVSALEYARRQNFPIINLSLTVSTNFPALRDAIAATHANGALIITATGNAGSGVAWPAAYPETLGVAATRSDGTRALFSNYGTAVDLAAPGNEILSTHLNNGYRFLSGTSMASPHVAALAGLIWSLRPDYAREEVVDLLKSTAQDLNAAQYPGKDIYLGAGQIDFAAALQAATADLSIIVDEYAGRVALPSQQFSTLVWVAAPKSTGDPALGNAHFHGLPVTGAVVEAYVTELDGTPLELTASALTDIGGAATIEFTAPITPGDYQVHTTLGAIESIFDLNVRSVPISLTLDLEQGEASVGDEGIAFVVQIEDPSEVVVGENLSIILSTSAGYFADRSSSTIVNLGAQRIYTGTLIPGTLPGVATLTVRLGTVTSAAQLTILAGPPELLDFNVDDDDDIIDVTNEQIVLVYDLRDGYGNPVVDGTTVAVTATHGVLSTTAPQTSNGRATAIFTMPTHWHTTIVIRAQVPGTALVHEIRISPRQIFFPSVIVR